ncbi:MAG: MarR family transcriptional regulator [Candidatus Eremiobacteraeota bacterium]|nr:MarR family transcriptional regulator [Candidatus Eremiobacteraeota bacterium]
MSKTHASVVRRLEPRLAGHHGLSFSELRLLRAIAAARDRRLRPTDLAAELDVTASGVTRAILPLEKRGIVRRETDPSDARVSRVTLTTAGQTLLDHAATTAADAATRLLRRLSLGQIRQLERLLGEIG